MADWSAFATAFLNKTAEQIQEGTDKASDYEDKQRELYESNKGLMQKRKVLSDGVKSRAAKLKEQGIPEEMVRSAIASGPRGIVDLERSASDAIGKYGAAAVRDNPDVILGVGSLTAEGALMTGENAVSIDQFIEQSYGISTGEVGDYKAADVGFLGRLYGKGAKDRVRASLDAEQGAMGYSVYDLNQAAKSQEYESIVGGSYVNYASPKVFTPDQMQDELVGLNSTLTRALANNPSFTEAVAGIKTTEKEVANTRPLAATEESAAIKLQELEAKLSGYRAAKIKLESDILGPIIKQQSNYYDLNSYQEVMGTTIDSILGVEGFTAAQIGQDVAPVDAQGVPQEVTQAVEQEVQATAALDTAPEDAEEVASYEDPAILNGAPITVVTIDGQKQVRIDEDIKYGDGTSIPAGTLVGVEQSSTLIERLNTKGSTPTLGATDATAESVAAAREQGDTIGVTKEEWSNMTRKERKALGLRVTPLGAFVREDSFENPTARMSMTVKNAADPDTYYAVSIPGIIGERRVKGSNLKYIPDAALTAQNSTSSIRTMEQGEELKTWSKGRLERAYGKQTKAEPKAEEGIMVPADTKEPVTEEKSLRDYDPQTYALLESSGRDMVQFIKDDGIEPDVSDEELIQLLSEWAVANDKTLPVDKTTLLTGIKFGLSL